MIEPALVVGILTTIGSLAAVIVKWQYDKRGKSGQIRHTEAEKLWEVQEQLRKAYQEYGESLQKKLVGVELELKNMRETNAALIEDVNRTTPINSLTLANLKQAKADLQACHSELLSTRRRLRRALRTFDGYTRD